MNKIVKKADSAGGDRTQDLALMWFRRDLRLQDNAALAEALTEHAQVVCVYLHEPKETGPLGIAASSWWLRHALEDLADQLNGRLLFSVGEPLTVLRGLVSTLGVTAVYWNRMLDPASIARDTRVKAALREDGLVVRSFAGAVMQEPWQVHKSDASPYKVFTAYYRACLRRGFVAAVELPELHPERLLPVVFDREELHRCLPQRGWMEGFTEHWQPTRAGGMARVAELVDGPLGDYAQLRNFPAQPGVSRLSPWLAHGQIGVRELQQRLAQYPRSDDFIRQLVWRDFANYVLFHWPNTLEQPLDGRFARLNWREDRLDLRAWQQGRTGIPMVDAAMRELWHTGYMHNRCRMIVASFFTKHLAMDWRLGAAWFMNTLLDADLANNTMGWQWVAGCGVDAAPYFRIFNPVGQGQKFDPEGEYIRGWIPELAGRAGKLVHQPWEASDPPANYPRPIVEMAEGRRRALEIWDLIKAQDR